MPLGSRIVRLRLTGNRYHSSRHLPTRILLNNLPACRQFLSITLDQTTVAHNLPWAIQHQCRRLQPCTRRRFHPVLHFDLLQLLHRLATQCRFSGLKCNRCRRPCQLMFRTPSFQISVDPQHRSRRHDLKRSSDNFKPLVHLTAPNSHEPSMAMIRCSTTFHAQHKFGPRKANQQQPARTPCCFRHIPVVNLSFIRCKLVRLKYPQLALHSIQAQADQHSTPVLANQHSVLHRI